MSDNYRDKIQEIRARRQGGREENLRSYQPGQPGSGSEGMESTAAAALGGIGHTSVNRSNDRIASNISGRSNLQTQVNEVGSATPLFAPGTSPFGSDKISLSLEGQIAMMEMRGQNAKMTNTDLGYTNKAKYLSLNKGGLGLQIDPPGTYSLCYHQRPAGWSK